MTQETDIVLGAIQFDDVNQQIVVPFTISNSILGTQNGPTQNIPYVAFGEHVGVPDWANSMPYSQVKVTIQAYILTGIGTVKVG